MAIGGKRPWTDIRKEEVASNREWTEEDLLQLDAIYRSLSKISVLEEAGVFEVADFVFRSLKCNSFSPQSWFNLFLYILEREPLAFARRNIVQIISRVVIRERRLTTVSPPCFTDLVRQEIAAISHAADTGRDGEVRIFLHQRIFSWIEQGIVSIQFLKQLLEEEKRWTFSHDRPQYRKTPEESPPMFDLVLLGIQGRGVNTKIDMRGLVKQGIAQGVQEGWMSIDEHGRHVVRSCC